jgi:hypothetical protein
MVALLSSWISFSLYFCSAKELTMNNTWTGTMKPKCIFFLSLVTLLGVVLFQPTTTRGLAFASCPEGMVSFWKLEEATDSGSFFDELLTNPGIASTSSPTQVAGKIEFGQEFAAGQGIDIPGDPSLDWTADDAFTIEFWMKWNGESVPQVILGRKSTASGDKSTLWVGVDGSKNIPKVYFRFKDGKNYSVSGTTPVNDGQWHHIVVVRDVAVSDLRIYVDGEKQGNAIYSHVGLELFLTEEISIAYLKDPARYQYFGKLDELAIYNKVLSDEQILAHYTKGLAGFDYCEEPVGVVIVSEPVTTASVGEEYKYQVAASGDPAPTFELVESPEGMVINEEGLITWTPSELGEVDVEVVAFNGLGSDSQTFVLEVVSPGQSGPISGGSKSSSSGGCSLNPQGSMGLEWLLLLMSPILIRLIVRSRRS